MNPNQKNLIVGILTVSLLASIVYLISSCGCKKKNRNDKETYVREYTGLTKNASYLYRPYATQMEDSPKDRCKFCKGYNNYSYEGFENKPNDNNFKLCPHNCREYGVALCNSQGKIM
jgi:hypothetical protein